jgi:hypothetical protein
MKDDAVAPVIAVMLILAAIVTFLSVWNAVYVPSMKQSAEVGHLQNVESAVLHFSSDLERAVSYRQDHLYLSEPVQLGGGDFIFNTLRSGGSLHVRNELSPIYTITFYNATNSVVGGMNGTLVTISYEPVGNFWQDQGYRWQYGYINVTKYGTWQTPLRYYSMTTVNNQFEGDGSLAAFARSFGAVEYTLNQSAEVICAQNQANTTEVPTCTIRQIPGNCSSIVLWAVNLSASPDRQFVSSNGFGTLELKSTVTPLQYPDVSMISFGYDQEPFGKGTFRSWNSSFLTINGTCPGNIMYFSKDDSLDIVIQQNVSPVNVTLNIVNIEISAY